jgi:hypothetical protein
MYALASGFVREMAYSIYRATGRYDTAIFNGKRATTRTVLAATFSDHVETGARDLHA